MKNLYDLLNDYKMGNIKPIDLENLKSEIGDVDAFLDLNTRVLDSLRDNDIPSDDLKSSLDAQFEKKHITQHGVIPMRNINLRKPWTVLAYAASISMFLYFSVQLGFNGMENINSSYPLLADSLEENVIDSNNFHSDTLEFNRIELLYN